jgi:hypothetical protein
MLLELIAQGWEIRKGVRREFFDRTLLPKYSFFNLLLVPAFRQRPLDARSSYFLQIVMDGPWLIEQARAISRCPNPSSNLKRRTSLILRMDDLLVGTLSPKLPSETSLPSVMSSAIPSVEIIPGHRDHRSGDRDKVFTITPES